MSTHISSHAPHTPPASVDCPPLPKASYSVVATGAVGSQHRLHHLLPLLTAGEGEQQQGQRHLRRQFLHLRVQASTVFAGETAVHLVVLYVVGKSFHFAIKLSSVCISSSSCKSLATILHLWSSKKFLGILFTPKSCTCFNITRLSSVPIT